MKINLDNPIIQALARVFDVCLTTLYFIVCSIPVVTFGASFAAMQATLRAVIADEYSGVTEKFFGSFLENFKLATLIWLPGLLLGVVVFINVRICWGIDQQPGTMLSVMRGITLFSTSFYVSMLVYSLAGISGFVVTWKQALNNALIWTFRKLHWTICLLLAWLIILLCIYIAWIWAFPFVAAGLYLQAKILFRAMGFTVDRRQDV